MDRVLMQLTGNLFPSNKWLSAKLAVNGVRHPVTVAYCNLEEMSTNHKIKLPLKQNFLIRDFCSMIGKLSKMASAHW